jgi:hypothetical protein
MALETYSSVLQALAATDKQACPAAWLLLLRFLAMPPLPPPELPPPAPKPGVAPAPTPVYHVLVSN